MSTAGLPNLRYEKKCVADGLSLAEVLVLVWRHPSVFRQAYPPRSVNNIYLDSPSRAAYVDHIHGCANRAKTRVRWYGERWGRIERPVLERKLKRGMVSGKESYPLPPIALDESPPWSRLKDAFAAAQLPEGLRLALGHLEPTLINRYRRHYFLSGDGRFRLTVDSEMEYASGRFGGGWQPCLCPPGSTVVVELKFGAQDAELAASVLSQLPFRLGRFSKYVRGIELRG